MQEPDNLAVAMSRFAGKVAIVTGSARGIGLATATRLAAEGATVVINDVDAGAIDAAVASITAGGGRAVAGLADISAEDAVGELVERVITEHGGVDILVNNAGGAMPGTNWGPVATSTLADWNGFLALNLTGPFLCTRAVLPSMLDRGRGHIVSVGSISGTNGQTGGAAYAAAKAGLAALVSSVAKEVGARGISCNGIIVGNAPHPTRTPERQQLLDSWVHLDRVGRYDEFAAAITFLCSEDASYLSGTMIPVDGGFHRFRML